MLVADGRETIPPLLFCYDINETGGKIYDGLC